MLKDLKVVQAYGWRYDVSAQQWVWVPVSYNIYVQIGDEWMPVSVEHQNPEPTEPQPKDPPAGA